MLCIIIRTPHLVVGAYGLRGFAMIIILFFPLYLSFSLSISPFSLSLSLYLSAGLSTVPHVYIDYNEFELSLCHMGISNKKERCKKNLINRKQYSFSNICVYLYVFKYKHKILELIIVLKENTFVFILIWFFNANRYTVQKRFIGNNKYHSKSRQY